LSTLLERLTFCWRSWKFAAAAGFLLWALGTPKAHSENFAVAAIFLLFWQGIGCSSGVLKHELFSVFRRH